MVKENGVFYVRTAQEKELEKRVKARKQELMDKYRAQKEERKEAAASMKITHTKTQSSIDREEAFVTSTERRRREEKDVMEGIEEVGQTYNGLHSTPAPEQHSYSELNDDSQVARTPGYRLNAGNSK